MFKFNQASIESSGKLHWYHWVVGVCSLLLTFSAWYITFKQSEEKLNYQFNDEADQIYHLIQERLEKYENALTSGVAALKSFPAALDRNSWRHYSEMLSLEERYPGVNGIGIIYYVPGAEYEEFLQREKMQKENFKIFPKHENGEYWPITYVEPLTPNIEAVGLDMAHEENRYTAAKLARDTGKPKMTGPIFLVQDSTHTPGFLLYSPWYEDVSIPLTVEARKEKFVGLVYAPFVANEFMKGALSNKKRLVKFSIKDNGETIFDEFPALDSENTQGKNGISRVSSYEFYGRTWEFEFRATEFFVTKHSDSSPVMILVGGTAINIILFFLFFVLSGANQRATKYAGEATRDLHVYKGKLEKAYLRLNSAMNAMLDGLLVVTEDGEITEVNSAVLDMFGYEHNEIIGKDIKFLMPKSDAKHHDSYIRRHQEENVGKIIGKERQLVALKKDGTRFPIRLRVTKGRDEQGAFFTGVIHDQTDLIEYQDKLEKTESVLSAAMLTSQSGFVMQNSEGVITETNESFASWLGCYQGELLGRSIADIVCASSQGNFEAMSKGILADDIASAVEEVKFSHHSGAELWGLISSTVVREKQGGGYYVVSQVLDINDRKELEIQLELRNKSLELSNAELNQFAYIASHDLKEPLRTLRTFTGYLLTDIEVSNWKRVAEDVHYVSNAAERMTNLINDLLLLSRVSNAGLDSKLIPASQIFDVVQENIRALLEDTGGTLTVEGACFDLFGDRGQLIQLFQNLISNAVKFHRPEVIPEVKIQCSTKNQGRVGVIDIMDNGIGVDQQHLNTIFLAFKKLHSTTVYAGTGIGLSIVKKIADRHGGRVSVDSQVGVGSCFTVELPLSVEI